MPPKQKFVHASDVIGRFARLLPPALVELVERVSGVERINRIFRAVLEGFDARAPGKAALAILALAGISIRANWQDSAGDRSLFLASSGDGGDDAGWDAQESLLLRERLGQTALVIFSNHPFGIADSLAIAGVVEELRRDTLVLANNLLNLLGVDQSKLLLVHPDDPAKNWRATRHALRHLESGECLLIFPSGGCPRFDWKTGSSTDLPWNDQFIRLAGRLRTPLLPIRLLDKSSLWSRAVGTLHPRLRAMFAVRQLLGRRKKQNTIEMWFGERISWDELAGLNRAEMLAYLREVVYSVGRSQEKVEAAITVCAASQQSKMKSHLPKE